MPHRNRVDPWGRLIETPARGAWFGNRGCLHDKNGRITDRKPPVDAWIICLLEFKGRRRKLLRYLKEKDFNRYRSLIERLGLRH